MPLSQEELAPYRALLGTDDLTPENAADVLSAAVNSALDAADQAGEQARVALSRATKAETTLATVQGELTVALSRTATATTTSPDVLHDRADVRLDRVRMLEDRGDITPGMATKLRGMVRTAGADDGEPRAVFLSRTADGGTPPIDEILAMFDGAKLSPNSTVSLNRASVAPLPGDDKGKARLLDEAEYHAAMANAGSNTTHADYQAYKARRGA